MASKFVGSAGNFAMAARKQRNVVKALLKAMVPARLRPSFEKAFRKAYWWGLRYTCPFCHSHLRTLLPFGLKFPVLDELQVVGGGYRLNARCPLCGSFDRERLLYLFLLHRTDIFEKHMKVLHVAPEAALSKILRSQRDLDYVTADLYSQDVMFKMDITQIQFPDNSFDVIICNHVLEHIRDDRAAIAELYRTLMSGGWAILQVPISLRLDRTYEDPFITTSEGRGDAFGQADHVRIYAEDYQHRLEQAGFKVAVFKWTNQADNFGGRANRFALNEQETIYFATKAVQVN